MIKFLRLNSIRSRMLSGFLFLTLLIISIAIVSLFILNRTNRIAGIHAQISQLQIGTLSLIKTDNDFFDLEVINSHYFKTHESLYLEKRDSLMLHIHTGVDYIYQESKNGVIEGLQTIDSLLLVYNSKFKQLEGLLFKKGFKDFGLEGQMRVHAHKLEEPQYGMDRIMILTLRRNEKDFFLRHETAYVNTLNQLVNQLILDASGRPLSKSSKEAIVHLREYQRIFNELAAIQIQIGLSSNDGLRNELNQLSTQLSNKYYALSNYSYDVSKEAQTRARVIFISIVFGAVVFSLISGYWISKRLSSPIAKLSNLMSNVMSDKKKVKLNLTLNNAADEINTLTKSFVHLMGQTNGQLKEIKSKSLLVRRKNKELKKLNNELDSFLYSTAHDLRSPLSSLLGLINIMQHENKQGDLKEYLSMMEGSIHRMDDFIAQIVGYSKNKRLELMPEKIDLYSLIAEIFESHRFVQGASQIDHLVDIKGTTPFCSDRGRVMVLFNNLISNAVRYADLKKEKSFIRIHVVVERGEVTIEFGDNGQGIAEEHVGKIFNMFYRANTGSKGSGLGLFIFKETISRLKGLVSVESELDVGTKFFIRLPNLYTTHSMQQELQLVEKI
jgi:signal transduction histidine kinase